MVQHANTGHSSANKQPTFEYSSEWAKRMLERGNSRSDRCERHRKAHRIAIQALAVPYSSLSVIGEVLDPQRPSGPLGGLGPLPVLHTEKKVKVDLEGFEFGMTDQDILQILDGLREKQVAVIEAGTGTGKSTFMPFRLMNPPAGAPFRLSHKGPIVVTEPRRAAAKNVARFVGEELCFKHNSRICSDHIGPGFAVGYQVSGERHWDSACDLIYVTDGTMINWVRDGHLSRIGAVIIDEAHERSENIDIILAQLREQVRTYKHLRVIITSATLDKNFFVEYFGGSEKVYHLSVPPKKTFGYGVPLFVGTHIDDDIITNGLTIGSTESGYLAHFDGWSKSGPEQDGYPAEDLQETTRQLQALRCIESIPSDDWIKRMPSSLAKQIVAIAKGTEWGDILGFLPTTATIDDAIGQINSQLTALGQRSRFDVYPLLATTDKSISDKATAARSRGEKRKIVVSSNLAETSLTVKGVRYIVDSGLICQPEWDSQLASGSYPKKPHSQSGVRQRWGRVGRDAPGWVFPLYTVEDFLSLPRNTPPGSAQTNLETFYMKLMAAGLELEEVALPANFRHESVSCDADALRIIETFEKESERAKQALKLAGAVDNDGHLTEYGRELERFPGTGSEALALMLAEQLACIHEVALALDVLGQGHLVGKNDNCIMQIDQEWSAAWRVAAAQRHRGLVIGCCDDLDIILRICSLWQGADDPQGWCETWWINEKALASAWAATMETVGSLSAAMKGEAFRPVQPALADRARAVLTRTMVSLQYERLDGAQFISVTSASQESETVQLSHSQLVDTGDHILAFNRFRLPPAKEDEPGRAFISHAVRVIDWAKTTGGGTDNMGLDLIVRAATHLRDHHDIPVTPLNLMSAVRTELPIGTVLDLTLEQAALGQMIIQKAYVSALPFRHPAAPHSRLEWLDDSISGFDREWDPLGANVEAEIPEEERLLRVVDPREIESNGNLLHHSSLAERAYVSPQFSESLPSQPTIVSPVRRGLESMEDVSDVSKPFEPEYRDTVLSGTVLRQSGKHLVIDLGLRSEALVPLERVLDDTGAVKFQRGDVIEVVIEREEPGAGYVVSYEKAQRLSARQVFRKKANSKTAGNVQGASERFLVAALMQRHLYALPAWKSMPLSPTTRGRIVGYEVIDASSVALVLEPLSNIAPVDPAEHHDLVFGQELEVRACGVVRDHESDFVQFARTDGAGSFYLRVPSWAEIRRPEREGLNGTAGGLSLYDRTCLTRLTPGAVFTGVAVPNEADGVTLTLLPIMYSDLSRARVEMLPVDGVPTPFLEARIIEGANPWGKLRIELIHGQPEKGLSHQFEIRQQDLRVAQITQQEIGSPLLVALERDRGATRNVLRISRTSEALVAFLTSQSGALVVNGNEIEMDDGNVSPAVIRELQGFDKSTQWRRRLWELYTTGLRLSVRTIRPQVARARVTLQPTIVSLLRERQRDIQDQYSVVLREANTPSAIEVASPQAATAEEAVKALKDLNSRPRIVATLPPNTAGLVLGKEHANRKRLEARDGVLWVWIDGDKVGVVGQTDYAVQQTIADIRATVETVSGQLIVPSGKNGLLIGKNGATIQRLKTSTGCQARNINRGETWTVDGPTKIAVETFMQMAKQIVGGTSRIISSRELRIVENTMQGGPSRPRSEARSAYQAPGRRDESWCFIATACYGNCEHPDVIALRSWRDRYLLRSFTGQMLVRAYYRLSPPLARFLNKQERIAKVVRVLILRPIARFVQHRS
jgi:HrpA-like RNA helicase